MSNVRDYIIQLQSIEEYAFSWDELQAHCNAPESTIRKEIVRLIENRELTNLRHGFYIIVPPRYRNIGRVPLQLYVEKLFKTLNKRYYIGLYSSATLYGASHQQIQLEYIITEPPALRDITKKNKTSIKFYKSSQWPKGNLTRKKSDAGMYTVSSPALTIADLIQHQSSLGGLNRMLANIEELIEELKLADLVELLNWYSNKSTLQRMGYILEFINSESEFTQLIFDHLKNKRFFPVLLSPKKESKPGAVDNRWKVDVNIELENDL